MGMGMGMVWIWAWYGYGYGYGHGMGMGLLFYPAKLSAFDFDATSQAPLYEYAVLWEKQRKVWCTINLGVGGIPVCSGIARY